MVFQYENTFVELTYIVFICSNSEHLLHCNKGSCDDGLAVELCVHYSISIIYFLIAFHMSIFCTSFNVLLSLNLWQYMASHQLTTKLHSQQVVTAAVAGGATIVQLREKNITTSAFVDLAR